MDISDTSVDKTDIWWRGAVIYQIYPRSYLDTTGDGIGDLRGCIEKLDYIASLGVDGIWLSPFFTSPMDDFGYDVADYRDVDPMFGTLADFDELVEKAHGLGLKIIIDQVYSHTSDQHDWFRESRQSRENDKADWYVWADPRPDGSPPNNWQSVFGGASWEWDARRRQYYLHNFLKSQPDLNLHNPVVQDALLDVARFWLDRGVDGFRLDALNFGMHDQQLRDNPPARVFHRPPTRPFDFQDHVFSKSRPEITGFLERIRELTDLYDGIFTVAEIAGDESLAEMKMYTEGAARLNSAYSFEYLYAKTLSADLVRTKTIEWRESDGWPSWAFSNHDAPRAVSRWAGTVPVENYTRFAMLLLMSLRGNAFLYQGEELGLVQADVPFERLQDPEAIINWPETLGRDGARTPVPWDSAKLHAGFSTAEPWLPVDPAHIPCAVNEQDTDQDSMLNFTRQLIARRKSSPALHHGSIRFLETPSDIVAFIRSTDKGDDRLCVFNPSSSMVEWQAAPSWSIDIAVNIVNDISPPEKLPPAAGYIARRS
ncbi:alpha-glucosidase [Parvularcula flava]|uniref:Alpha-glucosidase n=1 Tax=Aquisalinus luteolus TaxID=1566827 RepID=A0A8J3A0Q1_9PROT|nr:alpha-glucosidase [Aquisalinus luteolus]NHK26823.1 alpha-glucosidase [Aquisalinus luteolus]GGH93520.1 alpha-glucosidase [Aquisalinus luteolus]